LYQYQQQQLLQQQHQQQQQQQQEETTYNGARRRRVDFCVLRQVRNGKHRRCHHCYAHATVPSALGGRCGWPIVIAIIANAA
jgi:hypothetical protein